MSRKKQGKHAKTKKSILLVFFEGIFLISFIGLLCYFYSAHAQKKEYAELLPNIKIEEGKINENVTERMLQVRSLSEENPEIVGWLEIAGADISYPVLQAVDNEYYLTHDYKKKKTPIGSLFLDCEYDFSIPSSNLLIYGHRNRKGLMFENLTKYKKEEFYQKNPTIQLTTKEEDKTYEILSVFESRVYKKEEKDVFRYYQFVHAKTEEEYIDFVEEAKKASMYPTGKTAVYGEQLLTLSTCDYSSKDGRFVVVAKEISKPEK